MPVPLGRQALDGPQPLGQAGQREEGFLSRGKPRRVLLLGLLQLRFEVAGPAERGLQGGARLAGRCLVGLVLDQLGGERRIVIGQQPELRVPQVGLDDGSLAGNLGLPPERLQPPAEFRGEIDEPGQVGLHRLELADCLLLAARGA